GEGVQGGCGGEEVRNGRFGKGQESSLRMGAREEPAGDLRARPFAKTAQQQDGGRRSRCDSAGRPGLIRKGAVGCAKRSERIEQAAPIRLLDTEIFISPERQERSVHAPSPAAWGRRVAAFTAAIALDALQDSFSRHVPEIAAGDGRPAAAETGQMDEVEAVAVAEALEVGAGLRERWILAQGEETLQAEHRIVEIARAAAVRESTVGKMLAASELADQAAGVT